jgi:hypothetical protein
MFHRYLNLKTAVTLFTFLVLFSVNSLAGPMYYNYENVGTSSNSYPFNESAGKMVNWLFLPGGFTQPTPLPAGNQITDVYFYMTLAGTRTYSDLTIKIAQDDITTLTSGQFYPGPWETVFSSSSITLTATDLSWLGITLDTPFLYDPTKSLIVSVEQSGSTGTDQMRVRQNVLSDIRRVWSEGGSPFTPFNAGDAYLVNLGFDVAAVPLPGAAVLGALGLSFAGWRLRRKENN